MKPLYRKLLLGSACTIALTLGWYLTVSWIAAKSIINQSENQHFKAAVVLGTSKYLKSGAPNQFFTHRIEKAAEIFNAGLVDEIYLTGWTDGKYDEMKWMKEDLLKKGIPESVIVLDPIGKRTEASIQHAKANYGTEKVVIVSQRFHNERALLLSKHIGLNAVAINAEDPPFKDWMLIQFREIGSRIALINDLRQ